MALNFRVLFSQISPVPCEFPGLQKRMRFVVLDPEELVVQDDHLPTSCLHCCAWMLFHGPQARKRVTSLTPAQCDLLVPSVSASETAGQLAQGRGSCITVGGVVARWVEVLRGARGGQASPSPEAPCRPAVS